VPHKLRCLLLCKDKEHEQLFRPILEAKFGRHRVRLEPRRGKEGGFTFVLARLKVAVAFLRKRTGEAVGLLVAMDADDAGFQRRHEDIKKALHKEGLDGKGLERVAICIPSRNVETWGLWLCGFRDLDEHRDFKKRFEREVKPGLRPKQLVEAWCVSLSEQDTQEEERVLPALAHGRREVARLQQLAKP
jgi:hypothetical protein